MSEELKKDSGIGKRARSILAKVVESYLNQGHPISSKLISEKLNSLLSPSSIRSVMAKLEDQGYL